MRQADELMHAIRISLHGWSDVALNNERSIIGARSIIEHGAGITGRKITHRDLGSVLFVSKKPSCVGTTTTKQDSSGTGFVGTVI